MTGTVSFLTPIWNYVDALVPAAAQQDALTAARHRAFIAPRLLGSLIALASLPVYLVVRGVPNVIEIVVFSWLVTPILIAYYLSRTGRYESAHVLSSLSLSGLALLVALYTGGISSFAAIWLVVVPVEASLSASRRVVLISAAFSLAAAVMLLALSASGLLSPPLAAADEHGALAALAIISAALYATCLALGAESLSRTGTWLLNAEESRYRLLARNITDVIVRHGRAGSVLFVSPAAERLLGVPANDLSGNRLFDRVHVADRPAYLAALADAANMREERSVEFRVQRDIGARRPGQFIWVEMRCRPLDHVLVECNMVDQEVVAVLRDVSERKTQESAIEAARSDSERASAGKSRFIATMSHELRTPLNAIIGFSEMLMNRSLEINPSRQLEYVKLVNESGRHLLSVVNGILDASKIEAGHFEITREPLAPAPVIENCAELLALKAREIGIGAQAARCSKSSGDSGRQACPKSDLDQSHFKRRQVHTPWRMRDPGRFK